MRVPRAVLAFTADKPAATHRWIHDGDTIAVARSTACLGAPWLPYTRDMPSYLSDVAIVRGILRLLRNGEDHVVVLVTGGAASSEAILALN